MVSKNNTVKSIKIQTIKSTLRPLKPLAVCVALSLGAVSVGTAVASEPARDALPRGGKITGGDASILQRDSALVIEQKSQKLITDWDSFDIGRDASVTFIQPSADASALNRIHSVNPTHIFGQLNANGKIYLVNAQGIIFGRDAQVNVGSLVASTLNLSDQDYLNNTLTFHGSNDSTIGRIENYGQLAAAVGGTVALLSEQVINHGTITSPSGQIYLAAGQTVSLDLDTSTGLSIDVSAGRLNALVENHQAVIAAGGQVILTARGVDALTQSVVNNQGLIEASSLTEQGGRIILEGDRISLTAQSVINATGASGGGEILIGGDWQGGANAERRVFDDPNAIRQAVTVTMAEGASIDASATDNGDGGTVVLWSDISNANSITTASGSIYAKGGQYGGDGGQIETSGATLTIDGIDIHAGTSYGESGLWLIDPFNYTINTTAASNIVTALNNSTSVTVTTQSNVADYGSDGNSGGAGDITVSAPIIASTGNANLTLQADGSIFVNADITTVGSGNITLDATRIVHAAGVSVTTNGADISYFASSFIPTSETDNAIRLDGAAGSLATINARGGNINLTAIFANGGVQGGPDRALGGQFANIITSGNGSITITGDATNNPNTGTTAWGMQVANTTIQSENGNITLELTGGKATVNSRGLAIDNSSFSVSSKSGTIAVKDKKPVGLTGNYSGLYFRPNAANAISFGANGTDITISSSNIIIQSDAVTFDFNSTFFNSSGEVSIIPENSSFSRALNTSLVNVSSSATLFALGIAGNTADITVSRAQSIAGPISIYGGNISLNKNLTSTTASDISFFASNNINTDEDGVTVSTLGGNVIFNANTDGNGGAINLDRTTVESNGGNISLVGGSDGSGYAQGIATDGFADGLTSQTLLKGIFLNGTYLDASGTSSGGNIVLRGKGWQGTANTTNGLFPIGIDIVAYDLFSNTRGTKIITNGAGTISLDGIGGNQNTNSAHNVGINFFSSNAAPNTISTENGAITLRGTAGDQTLSSLYAGFNLDGGVASIYSASGGITIEGVGANSTDIGIRSVATMNIGWDGTNAGTSGNVVLSANSITSTSSINVKATGTLTVQPYGTSFDNALSWPFANSTINSGITGLTLGKPSNTANVSITTAQTIAGPITVYGGNITVNQNLTSTASGADILLKASGNIATAASRTLQTDGGDITLWADADGADGGAITLGNSNTLDSRSSTARAASSTLTATGGGHITLAGGSAVDANGLPTGYASHQTGNGVSLGATASSTVTTFYSGGGNITIRGKSSAPSSNGDSAKAGLFDYGRLLVNAASGSITIMGESVNGVGLNFSNTFDSNRNSGDYSLQLLSTKTNDTAISVIGRSTNQFGMLFNSENPKLIQSSGVGGAINVNGRSDTAGWAGVAIKNLNVLAASGAITVDAGATGLFVNNVGARFGGFAGSSVETSTSNITLVADSLNLSAPISGFSHASNTSGTVTIQPSGDDFTASTTLTDFSFSGNETGLAIGKSATSADGTDDVDVTLGTLNIKGPISVYGKNITVNQNLTSTASEADILLKGSGKITLAAGKVIQSNNGDIVLWANAAGGTAGGIDINNNAGINSANGATNQLTGGGSIILGGGSASRTLASGTVVPTGAADGTGSSMSGIHLGTRDQATDIRIYSGGGDVSLSGKSTSGPYMGVEWAEIGLIDAGNGSISIAGSSVGWNGIHLGAYGGSFTLKAAAGVSIDGSTTSGSGDRGFWGENGNIVVTGNGAIDITGAAANSTSVGAYLLGNALAASGDITLDGGVKGVWLSSATLGKKASTDVTSSISAVNLIGGVITTSTATIDTSGAVTLNPSGDDFTSAVDLSTLSVLNPSSLIIGKSATSADGTSDLAVTLGAIDINGPISVYGANITVNQNLNTTGGEVDGDVTLTGSGSITLAANRTITTNGGDVTLISNNGKTSGGGIMLGASAGITSAGAAGSGTISLGTASNSAIGAIQAGNTVSGTSQALYGGVMLSDANTLNAGSSAIAIYGKATGATATYGVYLNSSTISGGAVTIIGDGSAANTTNGDNGVAILQASRITASGALSVTGTSYGSSNVPNRGLSLFTSSADNLQIKTSGTSAMTLTGVSGTNSNSSTMGIYSIGAMIKAEGGGDITLDGTSKGQGQSATGVYLVAEGLRSSVVSATGSGSISIIGQGSLTGTNNANGVYIRGNYGANSISTASGSVTITGTKGSGTNAYGVRLDTYVVSGQPAPLTLIGSATQTGDVTFNADELLFTTISGAANNQINTSGTVTFAPISASFSSAQTYPYSNVAINSRIGGLTIGKGTNTANIIISSAQTVAGDINIYGGDIAINQNLTSTAVGADILLKGSGDITVAASRSIVTNAGDITLWSNTDDNGGAILLSDGVTLDSRSNTARTASNTSTATGGGRIALGGGSAGTGAPTGFALNASSRATLQAGVQLGTFTSSAKNVNIAIYSGGGDISLLGKSTAASTGNYSAGILGWEGITVNAGDAGNITLTGESSAGTISDGINLGANADSATTPVASTWLTNNGNITISGTATGGTTNRGTLLYAKSPATANTFTVSGTGTLRVEGSGSTFDVVLGGVNLLAASGDIDVTGSGSGSTFTGSQGINTIGYLAGSAVVASTSNITVADNSFNLTAGNGLALNTAGTVTIQPYGDDFSGTVSLNDLSLSTDMAGLTIGKSATSADGTNDATLSLSGNLSIAGPIAMYSPFELSGNVTFDTSAADGDITFASTIDGGYDLILNSGAGEISLAGIIGDTTPLAILSLSSSSDVELAHDITTVASQVYDANLILADDITLTATGRGQSSGTFTDASAFQALSVQGGGNVTLTLIGGLGGGYNNQSSLRIAGSSYQATLTLDASTDLKIAVGGNASGRSGGQNLFVGFDGGLGGVGANPGWGGGAATVVEVGVDSGMFLVAGGGQGGGGNSASGFNNSAPDKNPAPMGTTGGNGGNGSNGGGGSGGGGGGVLGGAGGAPRNVDGGGFVGDRGSSGIIDANNVLTVSDETTLTNLALNTAPSVAYTIAALRGSVTFNGAVNGAHVLTVTGDLNVNANLGATTQLASLSVSGNSVLGANISTTAAQDFTGAATLAANAQLSVSGLSMAALDLATYTLTVAEATTGEIAGIISGTGDLEQSGAGDLVLSADNTYTGATTISDGRLIIENATPSSASSGFDGAGVLVIQPDTDDFASAFTVPNWNFNSTLGGLTIGKAVTGADGTSDANVTLSNTISIAGPISVYGGAVIINSALTATSGAISVYGNSLDVNASITATDGDILLDADTGTALSTGTDGINIADNIAITTINSGNISLIGRSGGGSQSNVMGYRDAARTVITSAGSLSITGTSNSTSNSSTTGFLLAGTYIAEGDITLVGQDNTLDDATFNGARITSTNGSISLYANTNLSPGVSGGFYTNGTNVLTAKNDISIYADAMYLSPSVIAFNADGDVKFLPRTGSTGFTTSLILGSGISFGSNVAGLTVGTVTSTANVTLPAATINGPILVYGGALTLNGALTASNSTVNLHASGNVTQTAAITAAGLGLNGTGNFTLTNASNSVTTLAGGDSTTKLGNVSFVNAGALTIGTVNPTGITATGDVNISTVSGDLTVTENISTGSTSATAITLNAGSSAAAGTAAGGNILLSGTLTTGTGGRTRLFSGAVSGSIGVTAAVGSGSGNFRYNADETTDFSSGSWSNIATSGTFAIYREQPTANITDMTLTMTYGDALPGVSATGTVNGDGSSYTIASSAYSTTNQLKASATAYTINSTLSGLGYNVTGVSSGTLTVNAKALDISGLTASNKTYDALLTATLSGTAAITGGGASANDGLYISSDTVSLSGTPAGSFADKNVGVGKTVSVSGLSLSGTDAGNYTLNSYTLSANISKADLTVTGASAANKVYDASTAATVSGGVVSALASDVITLSAANATFADKNVGTAKAVTTAYTISGTDAGNYNLIQPSGLTANITVKALDISGLTASNKTYDALLTATLSGTAAITGGGASANDGLYISTDTVSLSGTPAGSFADKNVGVGKTVSVSGLSLSGTDAGNYTLNSYTLSANISKADLTVTGASAANKVYDGTTTATVSGGVVSALASDVITLSAANATFANKNAGSSKAVTTAYTITGADAGNYTLVQPSGLTATITPKTVSLSATRSYDGTTDLSGVVTITGLIGLETLSYSGATANSKHVASANNFISAITLVDGTGSNAGLASNYALPDLTAYSASSNSVTLTAATLTPSLTNSGVTKVYDGSTTIRAADTPVWSFTGLVAGDNTAVLAYSGAAYDSKDVSMASQITVSGLAIDSISGSNGSAASDYVLGTTTATVAATITRAPLTVVVNDDAKFVTQADTVGYAGVSYVGFVGGETPNTADGFVAPTITRSGGNTVAGTYAGVLIASGASADNYSISYSAGDYTIVPSDQLLVRVNNVSDTYGTATQYQIASAEYFDGTNVVRLDDNSVSGASVSIDANNQVIVQDGASGSARFTLAPVFAVTSSAGKLAVGSYQLGTRGAVTVNSDNFNNLITVIGSHSVSAKGISASASGVSKVYDGTTSMTGVSLTLNGLESGDAVTVDGVGAFAQKDVGTSLTYSISNLALSGADADNYYLASGSGFSGSNGVITPRLLSLTASKTYDGTVELAPGEVSFANLVGTETLTYSNASVHDKHVATAANFVSAITLADGANGGLASNYVLPTLNADNAAATITPATLVASISNTGVSKVYDGSALVPDNFVPVFTLVGLVDGDSGATLSHTAMAYNDHNVATANKITVSGLALSAISGTNGSQSSDYVLDASSKDVAATISKAMLTVTADNHSRVYGEANPLFSQTISGFVNNENALTAGLSGSAFGASNTNVSTDVGDNHVISAQLGSLAADNYDFALVDGRLSITPRPLTVTLTAEDKVYDGSAVASLLVSDDRVNDDALSVSYRALFDDKNVGSDKAVTITDLAITGAKAGNYILTGATSATASATISRLSSVTWIGGATGNWFDPANWAGGAVPDLSNVANVIIPAGVTVRFNNTASSPATAASTLANAVTIESLGSAGSLSQTEGFLTIGSGGMTLAGYTQSGGTTTMAGDFTVTNSFSQGSSGSVTVGGNVAITDTAGGLVLGNLSSAGTTSITSTAGSITQAAETHVELDGAATFIARNGQTPASYFDVVLDAAQNVFGDSVTIIGDNVTLASAGDLDADVTAAGDASLNASGDLTAQLDVTGNSTLDADGDVSVAGSSTDLTITSGGATIFGTTTLAGDLVVTSTGDISQTGALAISGTAELSSTSGDIVLADQDNRFADSVTATANTVVIAATGDLNTAINAVGDAQLTIGGNLIADVTAGGNVSLTSGGRLTVQLAIVGNSLLNAGSHVSVSGSTNDLTIASGGTTLFGDTTVAGNFVLDSADEIIVEGELVIGGNQTMRRNGQSYSFFTLPALEYHEPTTWVELASKVTLKVIEPLDAVQLRGTTVVIDSNDHIGTTAELIMPR